MVRPTPMTSGTPDPTPFARYLEKGHQAPWVAECLEAQAFVEQLFAHAKDLEWLRGYAAACPVAGVAPDQYGARVLQVASGGLAVAAIHFRGPRHQIPWGGRSHELVLGNRGETGEIRPASGEPSREAPRGSRGCRRRRCRHGFQGGPASR